MSLSKYFDHTQLSPDAREQDIRTLCQDAKDYQVKSVCVQPYYLPLARALLQGSDVLTCSVVGFPLGQNSSELKKLEAKLLLEQGCDELDLVLNRSLLIDEEYEALIKEIREIKGLCGSRILKVILETSTLSDEQIIRACELVRESGADFVKTSTGFVGKGAQVKHVKMMKEHFGLQVKASGGIRTLEDALRMIDAGATRIGASSTVSILQEATGNNDSQEY